MEPIFFASQDEFHHWLAENHDRAAELQVGFYKKSAGQTGMSYPESVDEALCFGWIDGVRKTLDDHRYMIRFTPRKPRSNWSEVNVKRVGELTAEGRMQPSGLKAFDARNPEKTAQYSYEARNRPLDEAYESVFKANAQAWNFFRAQPASYRRAGNWYVMSARQEATRQKRLAMLIEASERRERLAQIIYTRKT